MIVIRSLRGWGFLGFLKMIFYEIQFMLFDGFNTFRNIGYKSKNHHKDDNHNIPTPAIYIKEVEKIFKNFNNFTFVDVGSGRGRVLKVAQKLNLEKIISIEKSKKLNTELKELFRSEVDFFEEDAKNFVLKNSPNVIFYFFESFNELVFIEFIKRQIENSIFDSMFVVLVYSQEENNLKKYLGDFDLYHSLVFSKRRKLIILKKK